MALRRRAFLSGGSIFAASVAFGAGRGRGEPPEVVDTVVVGAGYAGAVAALRLAQAGLRCVVLERGRRWRITDAADTFATPERPDGRAFWVADPGGGTVLSTGVLEAYPARGIVGLLGAGVGGGSLVNNAVLIAPSARGFRRTFAGILDYADMTDIWYPRARRLLGVEPIPTDVLDSPAYSGAREFADLAAHSGFEPVRLDMGMDWSVVRREIAGAAAPSAISGHSMWGINSGAKRSVDRTVLAAAEATGLTEVRAMSQVRAIGLENNGYRVEYTERALDGGIVAQRTMIAGRVVLAAGSIGTTGLLVRARAEGRLPGVNGEIGRRWGTGGDHLVAIGGFPPPEAGQGGPAHIGVFDEDGDVPVSILSFPLGTTLGGGLAGGALAVSDPPAVGTVRYDAGVVVDWPASHPAVTRIAAAVQATADRFARARAGTSVAVSGAPTTSHSLGGVVFGAATTDSGEVVGCPNLHVVDSALLPGSCGAAPPALTVTALADRCITTLIDHLDH